MTRNECLQEAIKNVTGQRQDDYGSPEDSFSMIAKLWSAYLGYDSISSKDVACMMALLKIARISGDRATVDSFVDLAGYAACGCELVTGDSKDFRKARNVEV